MDEKRKRSWNRIYLELLKNSSVCEEKLALMGWESCFVSKHTLRLLSEWKPIAPSGVFVELETNGSLFNEKNWSYISNLRQYHLSVSITVLSFHEDIYQELSGTTLPISNLIDNLHFVKSFWETGIINRLNFTIVYQEKISWRFRSTSSGA